MELNGQSCAPGPQEVDPGHIVTITESLPDTLRRIIAHLEVSSEFDHLVYREAELDAVWSMTGLFLMNGQGLNPDSKLSLLRTGVHKAHDLVAENDPKAAAVMLRKLL
jgi:hypothetical protein